MDTQDYKYIQLEFEKQKRKDMKPVKITKKLIDKLLSDYNTCYYTELYYDSTIDNADRYNYTKQFTDEEWEEYKRNYDSRKFNNWCEPYNQGSWGFTIKGIKKMLRAELNHLKKYQYTNPSDTRFYINTNEEGSNIYFYGRNLSSQCDYWFGFYNKEEDICLNCKKDSCWRSSVCGEKTKY